MNSGWIKKSNYGTYKVLKENVDQSYDSEVKKACLSMTPNI